MFNNILFVIFIVSPTLIACLSPLKGKRLFEDKCQDFLDCEDILTCVNNVCVCHPGYEWSSSARQCRFPVPNACQSDADCNKVDVHRRCDTKSSKCDCQVGFYEDERGGCRMIYGVESQVNSTSKMHAEGLKLGFNLTKQDKDTWRFKCPAGQLYNRSQHNCADFNSTSAYCFDDGDCHDQDSKFKCLENRCVCPDGWYFDSTTRRCAQFFIGYQQPCQNHKECLNDLICLDVQNKDPINKDNNNNDTSVKKTCRCNFGRMFNATHSKKCESFYSSRCSADADCQDRDKKRVCVAGQCVCQYGNVSGYYKHDGGVCVPFLLGSPCDSKDFNPNVIPDSECNSQVKNGRITCSLTHYEAGGQCHRRKCVNDGDCGNPNFYAGEMLCRYGLCRQFRRQFGLRLNDPVKIIIM